MGNWVSLSIASTGRGSLAEREPRGSAELSCQKCAVRPQRKGACCRGRRDTGADGSARYVDGTGRLPIRPPNDTYP
eukprot:800621-Prymnesium_polylepis.1